MRTYWLMAGLLLVLAPAPPAIAAPAEAEATIRKLYAQYSETYKTKDVQPVISMTTGDFVAKMKNGQMLDRKAYQVVMLRQLKFAKDESFAVENLKIDKNRAIVHTSETIKAQDANGHILVATSHGQDTWVHTASGWRLKRTDCMAEDYTLDGKPFDPTTHTASPSP